MARWSRGDYARQRKHILRYLKKIRISKMNRTTSQVEDLPEILVVADETIFVDSEEQLVERRDAAANGNEITSVMLYRPQSLFGLTLDVSAACDVARAFDIMIAALYWCLQYQTPSDQTIPLVHFGYFGDLKQVLVDETIFVDNEKELVETPIPSTARDCSTTGKEVVLYRPRFFHGLTLDLTVACDVAQMCQAISAAPIYMDYRRITELSSPAEFFKVIGAQTQRKQSSLNTTAVSERDCFTTGKEVVLYRPRFVHGLTLDLTVACDVARMCQTISAAPIYMDYRRITEISIPAEFFKVIGAQIQIVADETVIVDSEEQSSVNTTAVSERDCSTTGKEVVLYRPRLFHGLTLDLTVACDVARMCQTISAAPIYMDYRRITELSIPAEFFKVIGAQTQIFADETVIVDSEKQSSLNTTAVSESCKQQQNDVISLGTSQVNDDEKRETEHSHAFLYDDDFVELRPPVPIRPRELVKWVGPSDVTDNGLDLDEVESWEVSDMFATNEANFGYKSTFDETMSEYTTLLVVEDTTDYVLRRERACRLADEIEAKKRADQAVQAKQPKKLLGLESGIFQGLRLDPAETDSDSDSFDKDS
ncbi:putative ataxin-2-like protein-like isoform X3 [Apostichopus japonicus]|uniref:Putative ataxin-2-like protein-like isoform X3 n=1 Tax=Stichopus japonicus TaxID=307972 RepID=A0A2G8JS82_STIJA|nr:putative ataxin-2-like protein-like isoform X3 [Apostichopus japonicus]